MVAVVTVPVVVVVVKLVIVVGVAVAVALTVCTVVMLVVVATVVYEVEVEAVVVIVTAGTGYCDVQKDCTTGYLARALLRTETTALSQTPVELAETSAQYVKVRRRAMTCLIMIGEATTMSVKGTKRKKIREGRKRVVFISAPAHAWLGHGAEAIAVASKARCWLNSASVAAHSSATVQRQQR